MRIGHYLIGNKTRGIIYKPDKSRGLECYFDADFSGGWTQSDADNVENVMSRTGYSIMYAGCPIHFVPKLQTEITLSTAEGEHIALSQALRKVIPLISLMEEINTTFPVLLESPEFICTVHEDNQSCIKMA